MMRLTLTTEDGIYTVEVNEGPLPVADVIDQLVEPVLLAAGFHPSSIAKALGIESDEE